MNKIKSNKFIKLLIALDQNNNLISYYTRSFKEDSYPMYPYINYSDSYFYLVRSPIKIIFYFNTEVVNEVLIQILKDFFFKYIKLKYI